MSILAACDFVRGLCEYFEEPVAAIFPHYVTMLLEVSRQLNGHKVLPQEAIYLYGCFLFGRKGNAQYCLFSVTKLMMVSWVKPQV